MFWQDKSSVRVKETYFRSGDVFLRSCRTIAHNKRLGPDQTSEMASYSLIYAAFEFYWAKFEPAKRSRILMNCSEDLAELYFKNILQHVSNPHDALEKTRKNGQISEFAARSISNKGIFLKSIELDLSRLADFKAKSGDLPNLLFEQTTNKFMDCYLLGAQHGDRNRHLFPDFYLIVHELCMQAFKCSR